MNRTTARSPAELLETAIQQIFYSSEVDHPLLELFSGLESLKESQIITNIRNAFILSGVQPNSDNSIQRPNKRGLLEVLLLFKNEVAAFFGLTLLTLECPVQHGQLIKLAVAT